MAGKRAGTAPKERLSREAIVSSAVALADAEGLDAVTIRRLATDHGVTPMALYWHFKDKDVLLEGLVERVLNEVEMPVYPAGQMPEWHVRVRDASAALLVCLYRHPEIAGLVHERILGCEAGLDLAELVFGALREAGFGQEQIAEIGVHLLHSLVVLVTMEPGERPLQEPADQIEQRVREKKLALEALQPDRYANVILCADNLVTPGVNSSYQRLGLDILIEGIRAVQAKLVTTEGRAAAGGGSPSGR